MDIETLSHCVFATPCKERLCMHANKLAEAFMEGFVKFIGVFNVLETVLDDIAKGFMTS